MEQPKEVDFEAMKRTLEVIQNGTEPKAARMAAIALQSVYNPNEGKKQEREG